MLLANHEHRAPGVLDEILQLGLRVLPVEWDGNPTTHPGGPLSYNIGDIIGAQEGNPLLLEVPNLTTPKPADLLGQAKAAVIKLPVGVTAMFVNKGNPVPKGQGADEHGGIPIWAGLWSCMQEAMSSVSSGSQLTGGQGPDETPEGQRQEGWHHTNKPLGWAGEESAMCERLPGSPKPCPQQGLKYTLQTPHRLQKLLT